MAAIAKTSVRLDMAGAESLITNAKQRQIAAKAIKKGAKLIQSAAKSGAPRRKRSGALRQSIGVKSVKGKGTSAYAVIGPRRKVVKMVAVGKRGRKVKAVPAKYAHLVEAGTRPHDIRGRKHPGTKPQPFLKPAFDANKERAIAAARESAAEQVKEVLAKESAKIRKQLSGG